MSEFYNRYRRLFTEPDQLQNNQTAFLNYHPPFSPDVQKYAKLSDRSDLLGSRPAKIGRSPALDEFERSVLPRLKIQKSDYERPEKRLQYPIPSPQLPKILKFDSPSIMKESGSIPGTFPKNTHNYPDRQPFRNKYVSLFTVDPQPKQTSLIQKPFEAVQPTNPKKQQQRVLTKVAQLPIKAVHPFQKQRKARNRQLELYQSQLYGINQNPYAFVNSKLKDIKMIQKYFAKGVINNYKACLIRRHRMKAQIDIRRQKLKELLNSDEIDFNSFFQ